MNDVILVGIIKGQSVLLTTKPISADRADSQAQFNRERFNCQVVKIVYKPGIERNYKLIQDVV